MNVKTLEQLTGDDSSVIFECVAGSRAYGTTTSSSDEDRRGLFVVPATDYLSLASPPAQVSDERGNTVFYSLRRTIELLSVANPNIELRFSPGGLNGKRLWRHSWSNENVRLHLQRFCEALDCPPTRRCTFPKVQPRDRLSVHS